jgi:hypothetical protein
MTNELKAEIAAMFAGSSPGLRNYKDQVGAQQFVIELGQLLTDGDKSATLAEITPLITASISNWGPVDALLSRRLSTDLIPDLLALARTAAAGHNAPMLLACMITVLAADPRGR